MKQLTYKTLKLENFKNFRSFQLSFSPENTYIYGANATGKTTIADALSWVLFGKDSRGATQFAIKTHDHDGIDIPNLDHSVELTIEVDGVERILKRCLKEKWSKPRGQKELRFDGNYQELFIDGQLTSLNDYDDYISSIVPEEVFKTITSTSYFLSKPWKERREFLLNMVGAISEAEITQGDSRFDNILNQMKKQSLNDYLTHLRYTIKEVKKKIDIIPIRIEEQNKALPEVKDWAAIRSQVDSIEENINELNNQLQTAEPDLFSINLAKEIADIDKVLIDYQTGARRQAGEQLSAVMQERNNLKRQVDNINNTIFDLKSKIKANTRLIEQTKLAQQSYEEQAQSIRERWRGNQETTFGISDLDQVCPFCGQMLPEDQLREKIQSMRDEYNSRKAKTKQALKDEAEKVKAGQKQAEEDLKSYIDTIAESNSEVAKLTSQLAALNAKLNGIKEPPTAETLLASNPMYQDLLAKKKSLSQQTAPDDSPREQLTGQKKSLELQRDSLLRELYSEQVYQNGLKLIEGIKQEQKELVTQLTKLEEQEEIVVEYNQRYDDILETKVNAYFSFVRWRMFKILVNGNREPCCEPTNQGTDFYNLNSAGQIMAGLDICRAISKFYQTIAPIVLDNAERINENNILQTPGQQIRLYVSNDPQLIIK